MRFKLAFPTGINSSLVHKVLPKDEYITKLTKQKLQNLLNNMPRKILGYKTPNQVWNEK
ncbi:MAG: IS30 family transposase, partial [Rickettsiales bacterium]